MELRVLRYFLAVCKEESITNAAKSLHLSQPTLSKQIRDMERQLGKELMIRGSRKVTLTQEGVLLKERAKAILDLVDRTEEEIRNLDEGVILGDLFISGGESRAVRMLMRAARRIREKHPGLRIHFNSGDTVNTLTDLSAGNAEFGLQFGPVDHSRYDCLQIPYEDVWGVLMRKDDVLESKKQIREEDLRGKPLLLSRQSYDGQMLTDWFNNYYNQIEVAGIYTLAYNASLMVEEGMGYALVIDGIISADENSDLCFRPLEPVWRQTHYLVWRKNERLSRAGEVFLSELKELLQEDA